MRALRTFAKPLAALPLIALGLTGVPLTPAQVSPASGYARTETAIEYNYVRSNAPPGDCTCFSLNGGAVNFAYYLKPQHFALVADLSVTTGSGISSSNYGLTLTSLTFGARYRSRLGHTGLYPFGQVLAGFAHASGSLASGQNPAASNASAAFAANTGGGVDLRIRPKFFLRLLDADYFVTAFDNGGNNHQNNLRIGAGIVLRF